MNILLREGYKIADFLTALRFFLVIGLIFQIPKGAANFDSFMVILYFAWLTDVLDGYFARLSGREGKLGKMDGWVDTLMYISIFLYGVVLGYYSVPLFAILVAINLLAVWITKNLEVNQAFHFTYILLGFNALYHTSKRWFVATCIWTALVLFFKRKRFKEQVKTFLRSWKGLLTGK